MLGLQVSPLTGIVTTHGFMWCWGSLNVRQALTPGPLQSLSKGYLYVCLYAIGEEAQHASGVQDTAGRSPFSPPAVRVPGVKLRSGGLPNKHLHLGVNQPAQGKLSTQTITNHVFLLSNLPCLCLGVTCRKSSEILLPLSPRWWN